MNTNSQIVVSVSMALIASRALASIDGASVKIDDGSDIPEALMAKIMAAVDKKVIKDSLAKDLLSVSKTLSDDGEKSLLEKYLPDGMSLAWAAGQQDSTDMQNRLGCYGNCYSNCHSACHGSRGWR